MNPTTPNLLKSTVLIGIVSSMFIFSAIVLSSYPQHLYLDKQTVIEATIGYFTNNTVNVRGNIVQFGQDDVIPIEGRDYIRITGNQIQIGNDTFIGAVRTLTTDLSQNILFEEKIGELTPKDNGGKIVVDKTTFNLVPIGKDIVNFRSSKSNYNIELINGITYFKEDNKLFKIQKDSQNLKIYLVGTSGYNKILFAKI